MNLSTRVACVATLVAFRGSIPGSGAVFFDRCGVDGDTHITVMDGREAKMQAGCGNAADDAACVAGTRAPANRKIGSISRVAPSAEEVPGIAYGPNKVQEAATTSAYRAKPVQCRPSVNAITQPNREQQQQAEGTQTRKGYTSHQGTSFGRLAGRLPGSKTPIRIHKGESSESGQLPECALSPKTGYECVSEACRVLPPQIFRSTPVNAGRNPQTTGGPIYARVGSVHNWSRYAALADF